MESSRCASICAFRSAIFCSAVAMASAPAMKRRGGWFSFAIVTSARADFARIAGLPPVPRFPILDERSSTLVVVRVGRFGVNHRADCSIKKLSAEKNPGLTMVVLMPKGATSACSDSVQPSRPNFDAA